MSKIASWCSYVEITWICLLIYAAMAQQSLENNPGATTQANHLHRLGNDYVLHVLEAHKLSRPPAPRIAVCMIGTRFDIMKNYDLYGIFDTMVMQPLGGKDAVDIFINTDSSETQSPAIEELKARFPVISLQALSESVLESSGSAACPSDTLRYADDHLPCIANANHRCSSIQFFRLEACFNEVQKHELANKFKYDWVARVRPDSFYASPIVSSKTDLRNGTSILAPCVDSKWGVCDMNTLVPRRYASDYFLGVAKSVRECVNHVDWDAFAADSKTFYPENIIAFHLRSLGYHFGTSESAQALSAMGHSHAGTVYGGTELPHIVRACGCPPDRMRSGLAPAVVCGEDIAKRY